MNKLKTFLMIVAFAILLVIMFGNISSAGTKNIDYNGEIELSGLNELMDLENVFCVEHGQDGGKTTYKIKASIHIRGKILTLKYWKDASFNGGSGTAVASITFDGYKNPNEKIQVSPEGTKKTVGELTTLANQIAAIFYTSGLEDGGYHKFGTNKIVPPEQLTLWYKWNEFVDCLPEDGKGENTDWDWGNGIFEIGSGNVTGLTSEQITKASNNWKKVTSNAATNDYSVDLYYMYPLGALAKEDVWQKIVVVEKHENETINIPVTKVWEDDKNRDGKRPTYINVRLYKNENATTEIRELSANNNWKNSFSNLPKTDSSGKEITYTVKEEFETDIGYTTTVSGSMSTGFTITNKYIPEKITVSAEKVWDDENNRDAIRPSSITVTLKADGSKVLKDASGDNITNPVVLNEANNWKCEFTNLYRYNKGTEIKYTLTEELPTGYSCTAKSTFEDNKLYITLNNKHVPELVEIPIEKIWEDDNNRDGKRPESIKVELYANGKLLTTATIKGLDSENTWKYTFVSTDDVKLYKRSEDGKLIEYTIKEIIQYSDANNQKENIPMYITGNETTSSETAGVITGNTTLGDPTTAGFKIINTDEPERTKIKVVKEWDDVTDLDEYRPESITLKLLANGKPATDADGKDVSTIVLRATDGGSNTWEYEVTNLYRYYDQGKEIEYTIVEENVPEHYVKGEMQKDVATDEEGMQIITLKITNTHEPKYDGYIEITGKVWVDRPDGKGNNINGIIDDDEKGLSGINVILKDEQGKQFDITSATTTGEDGTYIIRVNYDNSKDVYKLYDDVNTVREKLNTAYVEFEYDGMKYTTVKTATTGADTSKAIEVEGLRTKFDSNHDKITPTTSHPDNWTDKDIIAITKNVISFANYSDKTTTARKEVLKYCKGDGTYIRTNPEGAWNDILPGTNDYLACTSGNGHKITEYDIQVEIIQNVNLGLFEREQPDVAIFSDLSKVVVTMNGQQYTYLYNVRSNESNDVGLQVKFENKDTYTYRRPVNPADIAYVNQEGNGNAMTVDVTYEVRVGNLSTTLPMTVHNIINSYDSRYTLKNEGWTTTTVGQFNQATYNGDLNIKLEPQTESEIIELTYSISAEAIKSLLNQEATLNNAVEVQSFTTTYGANTLYAEQRTGGRTNQPYAGYDYDSHPGNAEIFINGEGRLEAKYPEDDTDIAPSFVLCKDEEKLLSGNVWEDSDYKTEDDERIGDGKKADDEKNLSNAKVELYKVNEDGTTELAKLYYSDGSDPIPAVTYSNNDGYYTFGKDGNYGVVTDTYLIKFTYGEGIDGTTTSTINGLNVNARNYKSTIISSKEENKALYDLFKDGTTDYEWHLKTSKGYSIAVDDMNERIKMEDLQYSNFSDAIHMTAYSKPFKMQVEFDGNSQKTASVGTDGETKFAKELNIFDFGIIERPREDIFVEKTIDFVKVTLANGQVLVEGNPNDTSTTLNYVKGIGFARKVNTGLEARKALDKRMVIEMDAQLIQQAQLNIRYLIKVTNNSEKDFDYYVNDQIKTEYYYFGTNNENSPLIKKSVNKLIDYIDTDYNFNWEYSENWKETTALELSEVGKELVSATTIQQINSNNYKAYTTEMFSEVGPGESKSDYAYASKLLANQDENKYENHIEILQIDAKTARTTGADESGNTIQKEYKPGNYVPSLDKRVQNDNVNNEQSGLHEQDDDRVEVVITPPTGATKYIITYIIAGLAGLIVISLGVIFIKKKVLTK